MIRLFGALFAGFLGLAFGSFLNVCVSRWPAEESIVTPRSHCRSCDHRLGWWENLPIASWLLLGGRCHNCHSAIGLRYPLAEFAVAVLWAAQGWRSTAILSQGMASEAGLSVSAVVSLLAMFAFYWILVALAVLDVENLWLPDRLTLPGIGLGLLVATLHFDASGGQLRASTGYLLTAAFAVASAAAAAGLILLIRLVYWLLRREEGIGLGDAKLMALLGAWLGFPGALLAFALGILAGALAGLALLAVPEKGEPGGWAKRKLPLGSFLCLGGILSALWGSQLIDAYLRWVGLLRTAVS